MKYFKVDTGGDKIAMIRCETDDEASYIVKACEKEGWEIEEIAKEEALKTLQ